MKIKIKERRSASREEYYAITLANGVIRDISSDDARNFLKGNGIDSGSWKFSDVYKYGTVMVKTIRDATYNEINAYHCLELDKNCDAMDVNLCKTCVMYNNIAKRCCLYCEQYNDFIERCEEILKDKEVIHD